MKLRRKSRSMKHIKKLKQLKKEKKRFMMKSEMQVNI